MEIRFSKVATVLGIAAALWIGSPSALTQAADTERGETHGVLSRIVDTIAETMKKVGRKIDEGFTKAANKLEEKRVGEKVEQKLNKAVRKTGEGFEKAGKKIERKLED